MTIQVGFTGPNTRHQRKDCRDEEIGSLCGGNCRERGTDQLGSGPGQPSDTHADDRVLRGAAVRGHQRQSHQGGAINGNPTKVGVIDGVNSLDNRGLDDLDGALVLISAMHHVCPQHEVLMMSVLDPIAVDEICNKA